MCGLVGVVGTGISFVDAKVFKQLLYVDALRGPHSTGVAINGTDNKVQTYKRSVNAADFLQLKQGESISGTYATDFLMGHNRYATQGAVNDANAHPFTYGNVTLAHNGTLTTQNNLPDYKQFDVDSENIAYAMGLADKPEDVISILKGAFALTWYNDFELKFYIVRNEERPMWIATNKKRDVYYYSSEKYLLEAILVRNNIEYDIQELPVGQLMSLDFDVKVTEKCKVAMRKVSLQKKQVVKQQSWNIGYPSYSKSSYNSKPSSLTKYNIKVGDDIEFYSHGLPDIANSKIKGTLLGTFTGNTQLQVKCYGQPNDSLAGYYMGVVQSIIKENGLDTVIVNQPYLTEIILNDNNNKYKDDLVAKAIAKDQTIYLNDTEQLQ